MNPKYTGFRFPQIKAHPWSRVFRARTEQVSPLPSFLAARIYNLMMFSQNPRVECKNFFLNVMFCAMFVFQAALDLVDVLLVYDPTTRVSAVDATKVRCAVCCCCANQLLRSQLFLLSRCCFLLHRSTHSLTICEALIVSYRMARSCRRSSTLRTLSETIHTKHENNQRTK